MTTLSLGYDLTQPFLAGIVTDLSAKRGLAMGMNVFLLFTGFGLGSLVFQKLLKFGMLTSLQVFSTVALLAALIAIPMFRSEAMSSARG